MYGLLHIVSVRSSYQCAVIPRTKKRILKLLSSCRPPRYTNKNSLHFEVIIPNNYKDKRKEKKKYTSKHLALQQSREPLQTNSVYESKSLNPYLAAKKTRHI